mgnify:CR=1 FL=1
MNFDIIVIGGGISGLNTIYQLLKRNNKLKIGLFEKNDYLGGRIYTHKEDNFYLEAGAGRFNQNHILLNSLITELKLEKYKTPIESNVSFCPSGVYNEDFFFTDPFIKILNPVFSKIRNTSRRILQKKTFIEFCSEILEKEDVQYLIDSFGYYEQLMFMNCYDALHLFDSGMNTKNQFYVMNGGMSRIVEKLLENIKTKCQIYKKCQIEDVKINKDNIEVLTKNNIYTCKHCVFAIPKPNLENFKLFKPIKNKLSAIKIKPLCRIYSQFTNSTWFDEIEKTTTNNNNRYIIPINREKGLIMISYSDGKFARYWDSLSKNQMMRELKENIFKTFGIKIPKPRYTKKCYWDIGTAFWLPNYDSTKLIPEIMKPFKSKNIYICGENYSRSQAWIEGALETSNEVVKKIA